LTDGKAIHWDGQVFGKISDIALYMGTQNSVDKGVLKLFESKFLSWHISKLIEANKGDITKLKDILAIVTDIEDLTESQPNLAYYYAGLILLPPDKKVQKVSFDRYFKDISVSATKFYESCGKILIDDKELALFAYSSSKENILKFKKVLSRLKFLSDVNALYYFFEATCEDKVSVRESYYKMGPYSYLYWFKNHLSHYNFLTPKARQLRDIIEKYIFSAEIDIKEQERVFLALNQNLQDFFTIFQHNIYLQAQGILDKKEITSTNSGAFFIEDFYGEAVPPLFLYELFAEKGKKA